MKVVLSVWLDHRRIIHFEFLPAGETITVMKYCDQLTNLNAAIQEKTTEFGNSKKCHLPAQQFKTTCCKTDPPAPTVFY